MASVNKCIIVGNLGADPEVKTFQNGGKIANISIATTDRWTDKQTGEQKEATEWHRITFNDRLADIVAQYLRKGSQVYVEGSLKTRKYTDNNGVERYVTEIKAQSMQMLGSRTDGGQGQQGYSQAPQPQNGYQQAPQQGQWGSPAPQGYPQGQQPWGSPVPQHQAPPQGQHYQTINGHPTTTPMGQVPDEGMPF